MYPKRRFYRHFNPFQNWLRSHFLSKNISIFILTITILIIIGQAGNAQTTPDPNTGGILDSIKNFFKFFEDIVKFLENALEWIGAIFKDPLGFLNQCINWIIDLIAAILPSSPNEIKINTLIENIGESVPAVGTGIIKELWNSFAQIAVIASVIKIYKLIPFKAT